MHSKFRRYVAATLIALLLVTSQSVAVARGSGAAGQMVLCTGAGLVTVFIDETGAPTGTPHVCPDGVLGFLVALAVTEPDPYRDRTAQRVPAPVQTQPVPSRPRLPFRARAPPVAN